MDSFLFIRRYKKEDEPYCEILAESSFTTSMNRIFFNLIITNFRFQIILGFFVWKLYYSDIPFPYYIMLPLILAIIMYIVVYLVLRKITYDYQKNMFLDARTCKTNDDQCFWVVEAYYFHFLKYFQRYLSFPWLTEKELQEYNINESDYEKKIVGLIGVDKNIRLRNGASIKIFFVHDDYTLRGIGTKLLETVFEYCNEKHYSRVNLECFDALTNAINLCKKLQFRYYDAREEHFLPLLLTIKLHEFSYVTDFIRSTDQLSDKRKILEATTGSQKGRFLKHLSFN